MVRSVRAVATVTCQERTLVHVTVEEDVATPRTQDVDGEELTEGDSRAVPSGCDRS